MDDDKFHKIISCVPYFFIFLIILIFVIVFITRLHEKETEIGNKNEQIKIGNNHFEENKSRYCSEMILIYSSNS